MTEPRVIVYVKVQTLAHTSEGLLVAVRSRHLGLTAYGKDESEATKAFEELFNKYIGTLRRKGQLSKVLGKSGLEWKWESAVQETWISCRQAESGEERVLARAA